MTRVAALVVGLALSAPLGAAGADAQTPGNRWERQVRAQLERALVALDAPAGGAVRVRHVGPLNGGEADTIPLDLRAGVAYAIVGVCDDDCGRLELVLSDAGGDDLAVNRADENLPVVRFTPVHDRRYRVRVVMGACRKNPCWYGVGVHERGAARGP